MMKQCNISPITRKRNNMKKPSSTKAPAPSKPSTNTKKTSVANVAVKVKPVMVGKYSGKKFLTYVLISKI